MQNWKKWPVLDERGKIKKNTQRQALAVGRKRLNCEKCEVLDLIRKSLRMRYMVGENWLGSSMYKRELCVLVIHNLNMRQQYAAVPKKGK